MTYVAALLAGLAIAVLVRGPRLGSDHTVRAPRRARPLRWFPTQRAARAATAGALPLVCRALAGELRAGAAPGAALSGAADVAPPELAAVLVKAGRTADLGGNPARVLQAGVAGGEGLALLAACWEVSSDVGAGLAAACDQIAAALEADLRARREVAAALAGPRASALVLAALPAVGLLLAAGLGADPLGFALTPVGLGCLSVGLALDGAGVLWTRRLAARALR